MPDCHRLQWRREAHLHRRAWRKTLNNWHAIARTQASARVTERIGPARRSPQPLRGLTAARQDRSDMSSETQGDRAELRLTRGYVQLCVAPPDADGAKTISLARFGHYDVRLVEFVPANRTERTPIWLELYSHETQCAID